jgi:predicted Fe-S protein YdhL (DUF1289 family)
MLAALSAVRPSRPTYPHLRQFIFTSASVSDMAGIHITDMESAINWWRDREPSPDGLRACPQVLALAEVYGLMVYHRQLLVDEVTMPTPARQAWMAWYAQTADAPCIAICSTAQGDALCKGCGRTEDEVQNWPRLSPGEKRQVWRRITMEGTAWRFNRYAERARLAQGIDHPDAAMFEAGKGNGR